MRLPDPAGAQADAVHDPGVPAQPDVRRRLLGVVHHQAGGRAREDGPPRHTLHSAHQHFQQRPVIIKTLLAYILSTVQSPKIWLVRGLVKFVRAVV